VSLIWLAACGFAADWAGLHFMVGAFLSGAVLDADWFDRERMDRFRDHVLLAFMPVFFLSTGLRTQWDMGGLIVFGAAGLLLVASVTGKLAGVHLAGRILGWARGEASVAGQVQTAARFLRETQRDFCQSVVIESNHDVRLVRWAGQPEARQDVANARETGKSERATAVVMDLTTPALPPSVEPLDAPESEPELVEAVDQDADAATPADLYDAPKPSGWGEPPKRNPATHPEYWRRKIKFCVAEWMRENSTPVGCGPDSFLEDLEKAEGAPPPSGP
jgi:hypothetical protein